MNLWILRHGQAHAQARTDAERELTAEGRQQARSSATYLTGRPLQRLLVSPYVRAQQTADEVQAVLGGNIARLTVDWLTPDIRPDEALRQLTALELNDVLLVSHQPLVGALIGLLAHGSVRDAEPMGTASLAALEGEFVLAGGMQLRGVHHVS